MEMKIRIGECEFDFNANKQLEELGARVVESDTIIAPYYFFLGSMIRRAIKLNEAFVTLLQSNNYEGALPLIRVQMENANYLCAATLVDDFDYFYHRMAEGKPLNQVKDRNGKQMTTNYLVDAITKNYHCFRKIWDQGNKYVHPSEGIMKAAFSFDIDENTGMPKTLSRLGLHEDSYTDAEKSQILISMACVNEAIEGYADVLVREFESQVEYSKMGVIVEEVPIEDMDDEQKKEMGYKQFHRLVDPLSGGALVNPLFGKEGKKGDEN